MAKQIEQYPQGHEYHGAVIDNLQTLLKERMAEQAGQWQGQPWMAEANVKGMQEISDHLARIKSGDLTFAPTPKGHMYEVDINADPQQFLNWDKPLTQQSTAVQPNLTSALELHRNQVIGERLANDAAARSQDRFSWFGPGNPAGVFDPINASGNSLPKLIRQMGPETATQTFQSSGIPGIRYLDQGSRGAGQGTSNYVVFDPKIIDILRKYAIPGLISGGAAAGATSAGGS
jgi:hypothetical protein